MTLENDFYGRQGFFWWVGVIENIDDPLKLGRIQVRIIGLHTDDKTDLPTENLPWGQILQPANGSHTMSLPRVGEWACGFFQDNENAQIPVVMGVFNGIESAQSTSIYKKYAISKGVENVPKSTHFDRAIGEPANSRLSRGVVANTITAFLNNDLEAACDIRTQIEAGIAWAKLKNSELMQMIRDVIMSFLEVIGIDFTGLIKMAIQTLKYIQEKLKYIQNLLKPIIKWGTLTVKLIKRVRAIIDYINNLPKRLKRFLEGCLKKIVGGIEQIVAELFKVNGSEILPLDDLETELKNTFTELNKTTVDIATVAKIPDNISNALTSPLTAADRKGAQDAIVEFSKNNNTFAETLGNQTIYNNPLRGTPV